MMDLMQFSEEVNHLEQWLNWISVSGDADPVETPVR